MCRSKVRMYGCNRNLSAASREEPGKAGGIHVQPFTIAEADIAAVNGEVEQPPSIGRQSLALKILLPGVSNGLT